MAACHPWLRQELAVIHPAVVVAMGATAAKALLGRSARVTKSRGLWVPWDGPGRLTVTVHPSSILRSDPAERDAALTALVADLRLVATALAA